MSRFRPARASPPPKLSSRTERLDPKSSADISRSSIASAHELLSLTREEIQLIDTVIERAGPSATTFLTIFKAYNDVLAERGLDPHEVVYYGKLLKLGTMKGKNWGEKWSLVKCQSQGSRGNCNGYDHDHRKLQASTAASVNASKQNVYRTQVTADLEEAFTLHSHDNESVASSTPANPVREPLSRRPVPSTVGYRGRHPPSLPHNTKDLSLTSTPTSIPLFRQQNPLSQRPGLSDASDATAFLSTFHDPTIPNIRRTNLPSPSTSLKSQFADEARKVVAIARQRRGSVVNDEDAWKKIKMERDEADAEQFRTDRLQERFWILWKQGHYWILTTNRQISEARDNLILRLSLQRWRIKTMSHLALQARVDTLSNVRCSKLAFETWKFRFKNQKMVQWRESMRSKMKMFKENRDLKLLRDLWSKWRRSYRSELSVYQYAKKLQFGYYHRWKKQLSGIVESEAVADDFSYSTGRNAMQRCWRVWREASYLCYLEHVMVERIELRIMGQALLRWRKSLYGHMAAGAFYRKCLTRSAVSSWKAARGRMSDMRRRADKHVARQDDVLLRAVLRVWKARERGNLLERVRTARFLRSFWSVWRVRLRQYRQDEDLALAFSSRKGANLAALFFKQWCNSCISHKNARSFAEQYHGSQLQDKMVLLWRTRLRESLQQHRLAKKVDKLFAVRRSWRSWVSRMKIRALESRLLQVTRQKIARHFQTWLQRTRGAKRRKMAELLVVNRSNERLLKHALATWTNRVIEIKLREFDAVQRYNNHQLRFALKKWKALRVRHAEEFSLMESYQYVKREETLRRVFHRWLILAVTTRRRRAALQQREDEMKLAMIGATWDKWRDRFINEKLRTIEYSVILQNRRNLLFRRFGIWYSKTKSLPAIRFHTSNTKYHCFERWRKAMPKTLQAKQAREMDRKAIYSKFTDKWVQSLRTKRALKAVARARYLRLPAAAPRPPRASQEADFQGIRLTWPQAPKRAEEHDSVLGDRESPIIIPPRRGPGVAASPRFAGSRGTRDPSPTKSTTYSTSHLLQRERRNVSPTRSVPGSMLSAGNVEGKRNGLWRELREVQRRSRSSSVKESMM